MNCTLSIRQFYNCTGKITLNPKHIDNFMIRKVIKAGNLTFMFFSLCVSKESHFCTYDHFDLKNHY